MYAIIKTGGKQYKVKEGDILEIEKIALTKNKTFEIKDVLLIYNEKEKINIGTPTISGAKVLAKVLEPEVKGEKVTIIKYKPKKRYRRKAGHRQKYTKIKIEKIVVK
jgi:large subunit ribosomal protein L21